MRFALLLLPLVLCAFEDGAREDVVHLKDGSKRSGFLIEENDKTVVIEVLVKGSKGQVAGLMKMTLPHERILKIEKVSDEIREAAREKALWFTNRKKRMTDALKKIDPQPTELLGKKALRVEGSFFTVETTCEESFLKEVVVGLEEVFAGYQRHFKVLRNEDLKIPVFLLSDVNEYRTFQMNKCGTYFANPAFYHVGENTIVAYNRIQKAEMARLKAEILRLEGIIEGYQQRINEEKKRVADHADKVRKQIMDEVKKALKRDGPRARSSIDRWKREQFDELKNWERDAQKQLRVVQKQNEEAIEHNRGIIAETRKVLHQQNEQMFETLYHEAFHAFLSNYLWAPQQGREVPRWLNEGMACYFERSVVETGDLVHGSIHPHFAAFLKEKQKEDALLPLKDLLAGGGELFLVRHTRDQARSTVAYAQSWLMMHYLTGKVEKEAVGKYVETVLSGGDPVEAFEKMTGTSLDKTRTALEEHLKGL